MTYYTRADWGAAKPTRTLTRLNPKAVTHYVVHFDGSSPLGLRDPKALLRAFQRFHQGTRGWADIAYNTAVFQTGDSAEGRGPYIGGHLLGAQNASTWGCIAAIGVGEKPTEALWQALLEDYERACRWAGKTLIVNGHTDWPNANKSCPGSYLLAGIRAGRIQRTQTRPAPIPTVPEEDIMASIEDLRTVVREELTAIFAGRIPVSASTDRAWETTRDAALAEAAELGKVRLPDGTIKRTDDVLGELAEFLAEVREAGEEEIRKAIDLGAIGDVVRQAAREGVLLALDDYEVDSDPRVEAWSRIAKHPFFADCYSTDGTLIDAMLAKLDRHGVPGA